MSSDSYDTSLILPGDQPRNTVDDTVARLPGEWVWLRNPVTGVIYKFNKRTQPDTISHALQGEPGLEGGRAPYTLSSEAAARAQAVELAKLQGRPVPSWAHTEASNEEKKR